MQNAFKAFREEKSQCCAAELFGVLHVYNDVFELDRTSHGKIKTVELYPLQNNI